MLIFSMSRIKIRMAACNIWSSLQESATVDISCLISDVFVFPHTSQILILIPNYKRLKIHYGDSIVVQIQRGQGKSNPVFSSDVSIGHVVATAGNLKSKIKTSEIKQEISTVADSCNDDQILHAAIRIWRRDIEKISTSTDEYPTANEVSLALSMDRMPLSLTKIYLLVA
jgi:hypothetical protein